MAIQMGKALAFTAVGGLVAGIVGCAGEQKTTESPDGAKTADPGAEPAGAKNCCKGQNSCKGKGGCAVEGVNTCKGQNECGGKGGCKTRTDCDAAAPAPADTAAPAAE